MLAHLSTLGTSLPRAANHVSSHVSSGRANRPPGRRVRAPALGPVRARRERSEPRRQHRPKVGYDVVRAASERRREERSDDRVMRFVQLARRVGLVVRLVLGSAPRSGQCAWSRSDGSRVELAPRAPCQDPSTARSARRRQRAVRLSARPSVSRQRPMSGCAAIGLALGRVARAQSCGRPKDQEHDRPTRLARRDEPYDAVVASLLPAPLRKRCGGVIPALRAVLTPGLASLARRERPARLPGGRAAWPDRLHAAGSQNRLPGGRSSSLTGSPVSQRPPTARLRAACRAGGRTVLLAGACGRRPLGRSAPAASEASPDVSTDRRSGMTSCAPLPSGAGRSEATTALCGSSNWQDGLALSFVWSWGRLHSPGSQRGVLRMGPVSSWHRARRARVRRRRAALVDGSERLG